MLVLTGLSCGRSIEGRRGKRTDMHLRIVTAMPARVPLSDIEFSACRNTVASDIDPGARWLCL